MVRCRKRSSSTGRVRASSATSSARHRALWSSGDEGSRCPPVGGSGHAEHGAVHRWSGGSGSQPRCYTPWKSHSPLHTVALAMCAGSLYGLTSSRIRGCFDRGVSAALPRRARTRLTGSGEPEAAKLLIGPAGAEGSRPRSVKRRAGISGALLGLLSVERLLHEAANRVDLRVDGSFQSYTRSVRQFVGVEGVCRHAPTVTGSCVNRQFAVGSLP